MNLSIAILTRRLPVITESYEDIVDVVTRGGVRVDQSRAARFEYLGITPKWVVSR